MKIAPPAELIITELARAGDGSLEDTPVVFRWTSAEHASPIGDVSMHLMVKTNRREIPGSNRVVEHAMAATWQPFTLDGEWDDKWGNRRFPSNTTLTRTGTYALEMFREFAKLVTRMSIVRVELDALSFVGIITDLKVQFRTQTYIRWSATLSPHVNEIINVDKTRKIVQQSLPKWVQDATKNRDDIKLSFDGIKGLDLPPIAFKTTQLDRFSIVLLEINDAIDRMQGIVEDGFHTDTESKLLLMASTFRRMRSATKSGFTFLKNSRPDDNIGFADELDRMRYKEWANGSVEQFWLLNGLCRDAELDVRRRAKQRPRAIYFPKSGESLERISLLFYGTADNWRAIYDKNNLSSLSLDGTEELVIPERGS